MMENTISLTSDVLQTLKQIATMKQISESEAIRELILEAWEDMQDIKLAEEGWKDYLEHKEDSKTLEEFGREMNFDV
ncbi:MAG: DUF6290 family protein [Selenomonadales bacterium]|nr:DUF6290 family protein [Selenomonadales bacterium]MDY3740897.1 DUF6290 family protein [Selenomonadaceae bacterium]